MTGAEVIDLYVAAWEQTDPAKRDSMLGASCEPDVVYSDPNFELGGVDALSQGIDGFHARRPGAVIERTSGIDGHHAFLRFEWTIFGADRSEVLRGFDVVEIAATGRLRRIIGFGLPFPPPP